MGTRKCSKTKIASASSARKRTLRSESKGKPVPMIRDRNTKSRHFARSDHVAEGTGVTHQLNVTLRPKGKTAKKTGQHLLGDSKTACRTRRADKADTQTQHSGTQEDDALPVYAREKQHGRRLFEDWEDQIIIERRTAGETWEDISKLLTTRTALTLCCRWNQVLKHRIGDTVALSIPKRNPRWTLGEEQLLVSLRESGKNWNEVAKQLPNRNAKRCCERWYKPFLAVERPPRKSMLQWEEWEERLLVSGHYAGLNWEEITKPITKRTIHAARLHWYHHFRSADQDEPWISEDLTTLTKLRAGGEDWDRISQELCGHSSNACRTQWYKETGGIQGSSHCQEKWAADEIDTLIALYNTIGPRWHEISKHIPGRTANACLNCFCRYGKNLDSVGEGPSEYWKEYLMSKSSPQGSSPSTVLKLTLLDEPESGGEPRTGELETAPPEATAETRAGTTSTSRMMTRNQQMSVDARKRKAIDIPMV